MLNIDKLIQQGFSFLRYLQARFRQDRCSQAAAALTYMSLFAIVPLMTVMYSTLTVFTTFDSLEAQIHNYLFSELIPSGGTEISGYMSQFSAQAKNLTGVGIGLLIITAILMLKNIEKVFNGIWKTRSHRSGVSSFLLYWAVLSLAPFCIGIALAITTYLATLSVFFSDLDVIGIGPTLLQLVPSLMGVAACTLIYVAVPNCSVPFSHALLGGLFSILLFILAKMLFTTLIASSSYTFIYGAFAAIPLFLLWLYVSWQIILLGAVLVHSLSSYTQTINRRTGLLIDALAVLHFLWEKHQLGSNTNEREIIREAGTTDEKISEHHWQTIELCLCDKQLIQYNENSDIFLSRDLGEISLWQLNHWLTNPELEDYNEASPGDSSDDWLQSVEELMNQIRQQQQEKLQISLGELFVKS